MKLKVYVSDCVFYQLCLEKILYIIHILIRSIRYEGGKYEKANFYNHYWNRFHWHFCHYRVLLYLRCYTLLPWVRGSFSTPRGLNFRGRISGPSCFPEFYLLKFIILCIGIAWLVVILLSGITAFLAFILVLQSRNHLVNRLCIFAFWLL